MASGERRPQARARRGSRSRRPCSRTCRGPASQVASRPSRVASSLPLICGRTTSVRSRSIVPRSSRRASASPPSRASSDAVARVPRALRAMSARSCGLVLGEQDRLRPASAAWRIDVTRSPARASSVVAGGRPRTSSRAGRARHRDGSTALLHDAEHGREPEARPLALRLRREERLEDPAPASPRPSRTPVSLTASITCGPGHADVLRAWPRRASTFDVAIVSMPPVGIASRALTTRFMMTCSICPGSTFTFAEASRRARVRSSMSSPMRRRTSCSMLRAARRSGRDLAARAPAAG